MDLESFLEAHAHETRDQLDLRELKPGDRLLVVTRNTRYLLVMSESHRAQMSTNREDHPSGEVRLMGCTFGASSSIKPDLIFCGGNLEFILFETKKRLRTSTVRSLHWLHANAA